MFSKKITESDAFLEMPSSTQMLYFHFCMNADDDGFVNNPKKIQKTCGACSENFNELVDKRYIILFKSGIIAIKHWKMQNYIPADRYTPTDYTEEKSMLGLKKNKPTSGYMMLQESVDMAIEALETVQKYKDLESELSKRNLTIDHIREYMEFEDECVKQEFTFKSLLEARYKQSGKKPILSMYEIGCMAIDYADGHGEMKRTENNFWRCTKCKSVVGERIIVHGRIHDQ